MCAPSSRSPSPAPSRPSSCAGVSSKRTSAMRRVWSIDLSGVIVSPGAPRSTTNSEIPPSPAPPLRAATTIASAFCASGTNSLVPVSAQPAPDFAARRRELVGVLVPGLLGDRERQHAAGRRRPSGRISFRCVSVPPCSTAREPWQRGEERRRRERAAELLGDHDQVDHRRAPRRRTPRAGAVPASRARPSWPRLGLVAARVVHELAHRASSGIPWRGTHGPWCAETPALPRIRNSWRRVYRAAFFAGQTRGLLAFEARERRVASE